MADNENEDLIRLYERFRDDILDRQPDLYYDEDDLVAIYDVAGDNRDRYVQLSVLMLGRKLFPESEALELRLGIALTEMYDGSATLLDFLDANINRKGVMWEILRVRGSREPVEDIPAQLNEIVERYNFEEDEEIIQFVNLVADTMNEEWLSVNFKRFVDKCRYRDTALAECAEVLCQGYQGKAIEAMEELTSIDPFNTDAWMRLAELYHEVGHPREGLGAIEYATALDPDNTKARYIEARMLLALDSKSEKATELLRGVIADDPYMFMARASLSDLYESRGEDDKALQLWREAAELRPDDDVIMSCLDRFERKLGKTVNGDDEFVDVDLRSLAGIKSEEDLSREFAKMMNQDGENHDMEALKMLETYDRIYGIYQMAGEYVKLLYKQGKLYEIVRFMEHDRPESSPELRFDPTSIPVYAATLLRVGRYLDAEVTARDYLVKAGMVCTTPELTMAFAGVKIVLNYILDRAIERNYTSSRDPIAEALSN